MEAERKNRSKPCENPLFMLSFFLGSLKCGDVLVFDRMFQVLLIAIRGSRCLPLDPSSANLSAKTNMNDMVAKFFKGQLLVPNRTAPAFAMV